jgi:hypothetical protein
MVDMLVEDQQDGRNAEDEWDFMFCDRLLFARVERSVEGRRWRGAVCGRSVRCMRRGRMLVVLLVVRIDDKYVE